MVCRRSAAAATITAGLTITHTLVIWYLTDFGVPAGAIAIGVVGIVVTRLFMSWLFNKIPVASLAAR
jgi:hypothetical protein